MRGVTLVAGRRRSCLLAASGAGGDPLGARLWRALPQLTYGYALHEIAAALRRAAGARRPAAAPPLRPPSTPIDFLGIVLALPPALHRCPMCWCGALSSRRAHDARRSAGWALLFVLAVLITAPAYAAFARRRPSSTT